MPFWAPRKQFMCLISWERTQKGNPHKLFQAILGSKRGPKLAVLGHKKFSLLFFFSCPYKRAPRELQNWRVQGNPPTLCQPFANPSPTHRQPFANPSPTSRQPFASLFCQPLSNPLFPWTPGTRLETRVNGFLGFVFSDLDCCDPNYIHWKPLPIEMGVENSIGATRNKHSLTVEPRENLPNRIC